MEAGRPCRCLIIPCNRGRARHDLGENLTHSYTSPPGKNGTGIQADPANGSDRQRRTVRGKVAVNVRFLPMPR